MDYTTVALKRREAMDLETFPIFSLYTALQSLSDPRRKQGRRYEMALILCLVVLAKLTGQATLSGATEWIRHRADVLARHFELRRKTMPCQMTYCNVLARVDATQLDDLLCAFFVRWEAQQRCREEPSRLQVAEHAREHVHLAIDGKTLCATSCEPHPVHQLSCYEVATGIVLWHCNVKEKENEISALKPLLTPELVRGRIVTADAMHTQRAMCAQIHRWGGDYVLIAKENQPTLREDIADFFLDRTPDRRRWQEAQTWNKGHGRLEYRHVVCSPDLNGWFEKHWEGMEQIFCVTRRTCLQKTGTIRHQVEYGFSSLPLSKAPAARILQLLRDHWRIENVLHWRRDVTLREDRCQTRTGAAPSVLGQLNSTVLTLMDRLGVHNVPRQMRYFDAHVDQAVHFLRTGRCLVF